MWRGGVMSWDGVKLEGVVLYFISDGFIWMYIDLKLYKVMDIFI